MPGIITINFDDPAGVRAALGLLYGYGLNGYTGVVIERISNGTPLFSLPDATIATPDALLTITPTQRTALLTNGRVSVAFTTWMRGKIVQTFKSTVINYEKAWNDAQNVIDPWGVT